MTNRLPGFGAGVPLAAATDEIETGPNYVTLMNVHLAKAWSSPAFFMTGMEEGLFRRGIRLRRRDLEEEAPALLCG